MSYQLECFDNGGFEDAITIGSKYQVIAFQTNSVLIVNDNGKEQWLGECKFRQPEYQD